MVNLSTMLKETVIKWPMATCVDSKCKYSVISWVVSLLFPSSSFLLYIFFCTAFCSSPVENLANLSANSCHKRGASLSCTSVCDILIYTNHGTVGITSVNFAMAAREDFHIFLYFQLPRDLLHAQWEAHGSTCFFFIIQGARHSARGIPKRTLITKYCTRPGSNPYLYTTQIMSRWSQAQDSLDIWLPFMGDSTPLWEGA